jgi:hypothetical protein
MSILTNFNTGHMKICHYREISDDAELVMLSTVLFEYLLNKNIVFVENYDGLYSASKSLQVLLKELMKKPIRRWSVRSSNGNVLCYSWDIRYRMSQVIGLGLFEL